MSSFNNKILFIDILHQKYYLILFKLNESYNWLNYLMNWIEMIDGIPIRLYEWQVGYLWATLWANLQSLI